MQQSIFISTEDQKTKEIHLNIGVVEPLNFPYNFFVRPEELLNPDQEIVNFFVFSLGAKRIAIWGIYLKNHKNFRIYGSCKYQTRQLSKMLQTWKANNYTSIGYSVQDRISQTMNKYLPPSKTGIANHQEYLQKKHLLAFLNGNITQDEIDSAYPGLVDNFYHELDPEMEIQAYENLSDLIIAYEKKINLTDLNPEVKMMSSVIQDQVRKISERFYEEIKTGKYQSDKYYDHLETCPDICQCQADNDTDNPESCDVYYHGVSKFT